MKKTVKKLVLSKETVLTLDNQDHLKEVAGASWQTSCSCTCPEH